MPPFRRFGRPGLLGTAARTAVVAGTATATAGAIQRRQSERYEQSYQVQQLEEARRQEQAEAAARQAVQPAPVTPQPPAAAAPSDLLSELERLGQLHQSGVLSDAEFVQAKAAILGAPRA